MTARRAFCLTIGVGLSVACLAGTARAHNCAFEGDNVPLAEGNRTIMERIRKEIEQDPAGHPDVIIVVDFAPLRDADRHSLAPYLRFISCVHLWDLPLSEPVRNARLSDLDRVVPPIRNTTTPVFFPNHEPLLQPASPHSSLQPDAAGIDFHPVLIGLDYTVDSAPPKLATSRSYLRRPPAALNDRNRYWVVLAGVPDKEKARQYLIRLKQEHPDDQFALYAPPPSGERFWQVAIATWVSAEEAKRVLIRARAISPTAFIWRAPDPGSDVLLLPPIPKAAVVNEVEQPVEPHAAIPRGLWERDTLLGDFGGLRTRLLDAGIDVRLNETSEVLTNPTGGRKPGTALEGLLSASLSIDTQRLIGIPGGQVYARTWWLQGSGLSTHAVDNLNVVSNIEAEQPFRLAEAWYQQAFFDDRVNLRVGRLAADQEFVVSDYAAVFTNASFSWPTLLTVDLAGRGPAFPLAALGARVRVKLNEEFTGLLGVFNASAAGFQAVPGELHTVLDATANRVGGTFTIGEVQYRTTDPPEGLPPPTYKLGGFYSSAAFANPYSGPTAVPPTNEVPNRRSVQGFYAVVDQPLYRPPDNPGGLAVFARTVVSPGRDSFVQYFIDAGVSWTGLPSRSNDSAGFGVGWTKMSAAATGAAAGPGVAVGQRLPERTSETVLELTYQAVLAPWWVVQPTMQYIFNPGGGVLNPDGSGRPVPSALVLSLRTMITF
jgi:porin